MNEKQSICDLCGLTIELPGFELDTINGAKAFCCEGCKGIFQMLNEDQLIKENDSLNQSE